MIDIYGSNDYDTYLGNIVLNGTLTAKQTTTSTYNGYGNLVFSGVISGPGGLLINNTGASVTNLVYLGSNNSYTGGTILGGGTLRLGNANALGAPLPGNPLVIVSNNAALDLNGSTLGGQALNSTNPVVIQGTNTIANQGVLYSSSGWSYLGGTQIGVNNVTLAGDATIGGGNWFGIGFNGTSGINGNSHNLVKVGSGTVVLMGPASSALASFTVASGAILFYDQHNWLGTGATLIYSNNTSSDTWNPGNWQGVTVPNNIIITNGGGSINNTHGDYYGQADQDVYNGNVTLNAPLALNCTSTYNGSPNGQTMASRPSAGPFPAAVGSRPRSSLAIPSTSPGGILYRPDCGCWWFRQPGKAAVKHHPAGWRVLYQ